MAVPNKEEVKSVDIESNWTESIESFDDLGLKPDLLRGIYGYGFEKPSIIQQKGVLPLIRGKDTIAQAQSGTGKTATFTIGILQNIDHKSTNTQALVVVPTRELAHQIQKVIQIIGEKLQINVHACTGGTNVQEDKRKLKEGVQVVVGTPGRVLDVINKGFLQTKGLKMIIFDEADEILGRGFQEQVVDIFKNIPHDIQIGLFSATMPPDILMITKDIMRDPAKILVKNEELTLEGIKQYYVTFEKDEYKFETLTELFKNLNINQCIIYCSTKKKVDELTTYLKGKNFTVSSMHGEMTQVERDLVMKEFRLCATRVLISTDLLARGIDVQGVNIVINFELPRAKETYIHRIGRSGRFGRRGVAINFVTPDDSKTIQEIEKFYNTQIEDLPVDLSEISN